MADGFDSNFLDKTSGLMSRKVGGIKVLYLVAVGVLILAFYAIRSLKTDKDSVDADSVDSGLVTDVDAYPAVDSGTVYVAENPNPVIDTTPEEATNATWLAKGVAWLVSKGASATTAQLALQRYLNGDDMTFAQGQLVNKAIAEFGTPPDINQVGKTATFVGKPGAPSGVTASSIDKDSATITIGGASSNGSSITEFDTQVSRSSAFTESVHYDSKGRAVTVRLPRPDTTYYVRSRAKNAKGFGPYSGAITVKSRKA